MIKILLLLTLVLLSSCYFLLHWFLAPHFVLRSWKPRPTKGVKSHTSNEEENWVLFHSPYGVPHTVVHPSAANRTLQPSARDIADTFYASMCPEFPVPPPDTNLTFEDILLIVTINYYFLYTSIPYVDLLYRRHFPNILYCGPSPYDLDRFIFKYNYTFPLLYVEGFRDSWFTMYECLEIAAKEYKNYSGYMYLGDDTLVNLKSLATLPRDTVWMSDAFYLQPPMNTTSENRNWTWWMNVHGNNALLGVLNELMFRAFRQKESLAREFLENYYSHVRYGTGVHVGAADLVYVPRKLAPHFVVLSSLMRKYRLTLELAMPLYATGLNWETEVTLVNGTELWSDQRREPWKYFSSQILYLHPFKYGTHFHLPEGHEFICGKYLQELY